MEDRKTLLATLALMVADADVDAWLDTPNDGFNGERPRDIIDRGDDYLLWAMIHDIEHGVN